MPGKIDASLNEKLQSVKWGEYELNVLFEKIKTNSLAYKTTDLPSVAEGEFNLPALTAGIQNQGLNNYVPRKNATILQNVISISANGANTGATFYQSKEFTVLQDAYAIKWIYSNDILTDRQYLFLTGSISKTIFGNYEWTNKAGWERIKTEKIQLPTKDDQIDFDFMESFIAELEARHIAELEAYLTVTGFKDYTLTVKERKAIDDFKTLSWGKYKMGDLYEKIDTKKLPYKAKELPKEPINNFILPCLTSSFQNQGLNYYAPQDNATILSNVISIPSNSDVYRAYYQSREFTVLSDAYAIRWKSDKYEILPNHYLFMVMCINKVTDLAIYSYKNKLGGWNVVKEKFICLPEKDGKIDFDFMTTFISAIQKLVIKDVVLYSNRKIDDTKA